MTQFRRDDKVKHQIGVATALRFVIPRTALYRPRNLLFQSRSLAALGMTKYRRDDKVKHQIGVATALRFVIPRTALYRPRNLLFQSRSLAALGMTKYRRDDKEAFGMTQWRSP